MSVELRPHQIKAVEELEDGKVLVGGVGTGKTITSLVYFYVKVLGGEVGDFGSIELPIDLYVFTTARKRDELDWQEEAAQLGISTKRDCSATGVTITVDSYNNIQKYDDVKGAFIILDEQRMVGSGAWTKSFLKMAKNNRWIMLSATPGDKWEDYIPLFVANGFYKNRTEFKRRHCVYSHFGPYPKLERYVEVGHLVRLRNSILVEMPYERHTTRHIHTTRVDYDKELFERVVKKRWHVYEERPLKDVAELFSVMRRTVNSDLARLEAVRVLMEKHPRLIVFYNFDYELEMLRSLVTPQFSPEPGSHILEPMDSLRPEGASSSMFAEPGSLDRVGQKDRNSRSSRRRMLESVGTSEPTTSHSSTTCASMKSTTSNSSSGSSSRSTSTEGGDESWRTQRPANTTSSHRPGPKTTKSLDTVSAATPSSPQTSREERTTSTTSNLTAGSIVPNVEIAEWNGHKHEPVPTSERWVYLVQYAAGAEAWNCTATDAMCFYSLTYSYKNFAQAQGRIDRLDTPFSDLHYYVLVSDSSIDKAVAKALKNKQNFNEKDFG